MKGKVQTVLGPVPSGDLGRTLTHEHLSIVFDVAHTPYSSQDAKYAEAPFSLLNVGWIRQNPYSHRDNLSIVGDEAKTAVQNDMNDFKELGGGTIVENTTIGITRNTPLLYHLASTTGVNVVAGTGYYVNGSQNDSTLKKTIESMSEVMTKEILEGCLDLPSVKCGIIGEVGCSWPLTDFERRSISASGEVQSVLGCPVMFHPGRHQDAPAEILRVYQEAGGSASHAVMAHLDRTIHTLEELSEFATLGSFLEYDLFGIETSLYQLNTKIDMPSDAERIQRIKHLCDDGYTNKILISHDIHTKHRLMHYGGHGYGHILKYVVPTMLRRGITQQQVDDFLINNPAEWLTFNK